MHETSQYNRCIIIAVADDDCPPCLLLLLLLLLLHALPMSSLDEARMVTAQLASFSCYSRLEVPGLQRSLVGIVLVQYGCKFCRRKY